LRKKLFQVGDRAEFSGYKLRQQIEEKFYDGYLWDWIEKTWMANNDYVCFGLLVER
jgi:hypothetical protein